MTDKKILSFLRFFRFCRFFSIKLICVAVLFSLLFVWYIQTFNRRLVANIVDEKFHGIDVQNLMQEKLPKDPTSNKNVLSKHTPNLSPEAIEFRRRLNLSDPGEMGQPVILPENLDFDIELLVNKSKEKYKMNEFVSNLVRLDREIPDIRSDYCKSLNYSKNLPNASVIIIFHNEVVSLILRTVFSILNRSPENLLVEIILIDDCSDYGEN
jgi:hypothetical protein